MNLFGRSPAALPRELLVVEDDPAQIKAYHAFARRFGISIRCVSRTTDVLRMAHLHAPEGIVLDVELEDGQSLKVLRALRGSPETKDIPVAVISGYLSDEVERTVRSVGGVTMLAKPWTVDELLSTLGALVARPAPRPPPETTR